MGTLLRSCVVIAGLVLTASGLHAQVASDMKAKIAAIGTVVDPPSSIALYQPLHPPVPSAGVVVVRDQSYGADPRALLDVFGPSPAAPPRPVLIFVSGGMGNKREPGPGGEAFYDNIMLWADKHGMIGVNVQRSSQSPRAIVDALSWVHANIARHGGDPKRIFIWGHSAGAVTVSNYLGHPELYGPDGIGIKGAILMSGVYDLYPLKLASPPMIVRMGSAGGPPPGPAPGPPPGDSGGPSDPTKRSILGGMKSSPVPVFLMAAELDPPIMVESLKQLEHAMSDAGHAPQTKIIADHGHMSEILAVDTADMSSSQPVLDWIHSIK